MSPTEIWIARGGSACGPYTKLQVDRLVKDGLVYQDDLAWSPGAEWWEELGALYPKKTPLTLSPESSSKHGNRAVDLVQLRAARRERLVEVYACSLPVSKRPTTDTTDEEVGGLIWKFPTILAVVSAAFGVKGLLADFYEQSRFGWATSAWMWTVVVLLIVLPAAIIYVHKRLND